MGAVSLEDALVNLLINLHLSPSLALYIHLSNDTLYTNLD
jgi:hypothetical protein